MVFNLEVNTVYRRRTVKIGSYGSQGSLAES